MFVGEDVLNLYARLVPGQELDKIKNNVYDLREILGDISKQVSGSMVKVDDFGVGDKVVAVKLKKGKHFLVLRKDMANLGVLYLYKPENQDK